MILKKMIEENIQLNNYIKSSLKEAGLDIAKVPNNSYLVGSSLSTIIESFFSNTKCQLDENQDIDIFVDYGRNQSFDFSGKLSFLNKVDNSTYSFSRRYDTYFKKYPTRKVIDPDDRYSYVNVKSELPLNYYIAGNIKDNLFDYTFIHTDRNFIPKKILDSFDFNSLKVLYDFNLNKIILDEEYLEYINSKEINTSKFVDSNSFLDEYDQILPSLLRLLKKTDNKVNYKVLMKLYFSIILNSKDNDFETILVINKRKGTCRIDNNNKNNKNYTMLSLKYIDYLISQLDFFENIFTIKENNLDFLILKLKNISQIPIVKNELKKDLVKNFYNKFRNRNDKDIQKINFIFDLLYERYKND